ncbi:MAG: helix-turn-helix domain-containing protein [Pseudolysinimonas sp.]
MAEYSVPALDKAFDVLDLLASRSEGMSQTEIAEATGWSVSQLFRVLTTLENRGWVMREAGLYSFSMAAFDLAHRHPPLRGVLVAATAPLRELSRRVSQSCNLSVLDMGSVRVIAQVESPADFGYRVRVGALFDIESATGVALTTGEAVRRDDPLQPGITDLVVPVLATDGSVRAAVTVPYVATSFSVVAADDVLMHARIAASAISDKLAG